MWQKIYLLVGERTGSFGIAWRSVINHGISRNLSCRGRCLSLDFDELESADGNRRCSAALEWYGNSPWGTYAEKLFSLAEILTREQTKNTVVWPLSSFNCKKLSVVCRFDATDSSDSDNCWIWSFWDSDSDSDLDWRGAVFVGFYTLLLQLRPFLKDGVVYLRF